MVRTASGLREDAWQRSQMHWEADERSEWNAPAVGLASRYMTSSASANSFFDGAGLGDAAMATDRTNFTKTLPRVERLDALPIAGGPSGPFTTKTKGLVLLSHDSVPSLLSRDADELPSPRAPAGRPAVRTPQESQARAGEVDARLREQAGADVQREREYNLEASLRWERQINAALSQSLRHAKETRSHLMYQHQAPRPRSWTPRRNASGENMPKVEQQIRSATRFSNYRSGVSESLYFGPI